MMISAFSVSINNTTSSTIWYRQEARNRYMDINYVEHLSTQRGHCFLIVSMINVIINIYSKKKKKTFSNG